MQTTNSDWNVAPRPVSHRTVWIGFPGLGKTTYALHHAGVVDLDFGSFRSALGVAPKSQASIFPAFVKLINTYVKGGFKVLSNEPGLIPLLKSSGYKVIVALPSNVDDAIHRVLQRASNPAFDRQYATHAGEWVSGWKAAAERYGVKVIYQKYFNIGGKNDGDENSPDVAKLSG